MSVRVETPSPPPGWLQRLVRRRRPQRTAPRRMPARLLQAIDLLGVPLLVFLFAEATILIAAMANSSNPFDDGTWTHWDSGHYLKQALHGSSLYTCASRGEPAPTGSGPGAFCGDSAWFQGYPWQMAAAKLIGLPLGASGVVISTFWSLMTVIATWIGLLDRRRDVPSIAALVFVAFIPGVAYDHAIFPMSSASFFIICLLAFLRRRSWWLAGGAGLLACLMHSSVPLALPVVVLWLLLWRDGRTPWRERIRRAVIVGGGMAIGTAISLGAIALGTGVVDAYFKQQASYGTGIDFPSGRWWDVVKPLFHGGVGPGVVTSAQALFVGVLVVGLLAHAAWRGARGLEVLAAAYIALFWIYPLTQDQVSLWRADSVGLLPAVVLIARMRPAGATLAAGGAVVFAAPLTIAFVSNLII